MRLWIIVAGLVPLSLSGCSAEQSEPEVETDTFNAGELAHAPIQDQLVDSLVDSFDVSSCLDAQLRYAGRVNVGESVFHQRRFEAPDQCLRDLKSSVVRFGFTEGRPGVWSGSIIAGTPERMKFNSNENTLPGNLVWEVDVT